MSSPSVTYSFSNGTTADATQVNQNFTDILTALSGGNTDVSFLSLAVAGTSTFNGNTTLGNASSDDLTVTAALASNLVPKIDSTYDLGSSSIGFNSLYLGENSTRVQLKASASGAASYTFTFPVSAGVAGQIMVNQGSATQAWKYNCVDTSAKSADYTVTDIDMIRTVLMTTSSTNRTVTLPTAADNTGRIITIKKVDSGTGTVIIDGEGSETIDGATTLTLYTQYDVATLQCDGSNWHTFSLNTITKPIDITSSCSLTGGTNVAGAVSLTAVYYTRIDNLVTVYVDIGSTTLTAANTLSTMTLTLPSSLNRANSISTYLPFGISQTATQPRIRVAYASGSIALAAGEWQIIFDATATGLQLIRGAFTFTLDA